MLRLLAEMNAGPRDILRTGEAIYKELDLGRRDINDHELIDLMVRHPDLIQRPILEIGDRAVLGRPTERMAELLDEVMGR